MLSQFLDVLKAIGRKNRISAINILIDNNKGNKKIIDINILSKLFVFDKNCSKIIFIL